VEATRLVRVYRIRPTMRLSDLTYEAKVYLRGAGLYRLGLVGSLEIWCRREGKHVTAAGPTWRSIAGP
jgi:hypothetical protein